MFFIKRIKTQEGIMQACSMASGGVFFIPDQIKRKTKSIKYSELMTDIPSSQELILDEASIAAVQATASKLRGAKQRQAA
jgi:hypothetical protein